MSCCRKRGEKPPLRVLLVDDDPAQRLLLPRLAALTGDVAFACAADGLEGWEMVWALRPQVLLLELILPGMSGLELLRRYRARRGPARAVVLTRAAGAAARSAALAAGADFLLTKPTAWGELRRVLLLLGGGVESRCRELLRQMGGDPARAGFRQAVGCAVLLREGGAETAMKALYIQTAQREGTSGACVEKNIRAFVRGLHAGGKPLYRQIMGPVGAGVGPPSNGVFLRALARAATFPLESDPQ